jgi:hypothetical protein
MEKERPILTFWLENLMERQWGKLLTNRRIILK